jgi:hypothetical protein
MADVEAGTRELSTYPLEIGEAVAGYSGTAFLFSGPMK